MNKYAKKIKEVRRKAGFSQAGFDKLLDLSKNTTNGVENEKNKKISRPFRTLIFLCSHPEVIRILEERLKSCEKCKYFNTCTTKGGANCLSFKPNEPNSKR